MYVLKKIFGFFGNKVAPKPHIFIVIWVVACNWPSTTWGTTKREWLGIRAVRPPPCRHLSWAQPGVVLKNTLTSKSSLLLCKAGMFLPTALDIPTERLLLDPADILEQRRAWSAASYKVWIWTNKHWQPHCRTPLKHLGHPCGWAVCSGPTWSLPLKVVSSSMSSTHPVGLQARHGTYTSQD